MKQLDAAGQSLGALLASLEERLSSPLLATGFGLAMGLGVIAGGIAAFLLILFILVNLFA